MKNDPRSIECSLCNCVKRTLKKIQDFNAVSEPVTLQYLCNALTNWAMKPLMLEAVICLKKLSNI